MQIGAIVQARTSSTRLPGKVLMELPYGSCVTVLQQVIRRLKRSKRLGDIIIATTTDKADEKIVKLAEKEKVKWFRGSLDNVLERYYLAAKENVLDVIVRITSDCPCIDPEVVDFLVEEHLRAGVDYSSNDLPATYPSGLDVEVMNFSALEESYKKAEKDFDREHVSSYIYKTKPEAFNIQTVRAPADLTDPEIRVTIDTQEDYTLLCIVFDYLYSGNEFFGAKDIIKLFHDKPWLKAINKGVICKKRFDSLQEEIEEAIRILDLQDLKRAKEILARYMQ
ncbi:MAG: glycosyltransferase family protein [Sedimentisphaerales bacterium]